MKFTYKPVALRSDALKLIERCNEIIEGYQSQDLRLTLRQLYYRLVTKNVIRNSKESYKRLGSILSDGRLAGHVDWDAIEDRVRRPRVPNEYQNIGEVLEESLQVYRLPRWTGQDNYVELWVEKDALAGVLEPIARRWHVTLMVNRGYSSQSAMKEAADRFVAASKGERIPYLLYLGDHDPSGEDMVRDVRDRLAMFCEAHGHDAPTVRKVALTMKQVEDYAPLPNPAKLSDSRAAKYVAKHGDESWELDALDPGDLNQIVTAEIRRLCDVETMKLVEAQEEKDKARLRKAAEKITGRRRA